MNTELYTETTSFSEMKIEIYTETTTLVVAHSEKRCVIHMMQKSCKYVNKFNISAGPAVTEFLF
jgi:hypothetical protein